MKKMDNGLNRYTIPVIGQIGFDHETDDPKGTYFKFSDLLMHLHNAKNFNDIVLAIDSNGGYCDIADNMIEAIQNSGKRIFSKNIGNVCSAASKIFLIPSIQDRIFDPAKGQLLIHNPWMIVEGDSKYLSAASKSLQKTESEYSKWYSDKTGVSVDIIKGLMQENSALTEEQIKNYNFATIVNYELKAVAMLNFKNKYMEKNIEEKLTVIEAAIRALSSFFKAKAMIVSDVNGTQLEFTSEIDDISKVILGVTANDLKTGKPADGSYVMPTGDTYVFTAGSLTEILSGTELEALKTENEAMKTELAKAKAITAENEVLKSEVARTMALIVEKEKSIADFKADYTKLTESFSAFKAQFTPNTLPANTPNSEPATVFKFKSNK